MTAFARTKRVQKAPKRETNEDVENDRLRFTYCFVIDQRLLNSPAISTDHSEHHKYI